MSTPTKPTVFISYSHKDESWKKRLASHLGVLSQQGLLSFWDDRQIGAGEDWYEKIQEAMNAAQVAILLVSANSLTSGFILREEVSHLLQRRDKEGLRIFPVILRSCPWENVDWLSRMQVRPRDGKPLASYQGDKRDEALSKIATEVYDHFNAAKAPFEPETVESRASNRIDLKRLPITGRNLFGRERELQQLDEAWARAKTHVLSLVAWGGVGKSALVNHWLARLAEDDYRGASQVYAWSFYSQGTTDKVVSADQFIEAALTWFGDQEPNKGSPWNKGERLATLVGEQRTLLVLDGLEPLQYPPGPDEGRLKDQALQALLRQLAAHNEGLALISTRVVVSDLSSFEGHTVERIDLEHLSPQAGADVLKAQGVKGAQAELEQSSREFGGHSLALTLLGSYLSDVCGGDINRRVEVSGLEGDERYGRHAQKVMVSYEKWFGKGPELAALLILGLFSRPADKKAVDAVRAAPVIKGLTDELRPLSESKWQQVLARLRRAGLLAERGSNQSDTLDSHPLVREHFAHRLKSERPAAWKGANFRLYEHYKKAGKVFPNTIEEMTPLYAAVSHGCEAGKYQEALDLYYRRIQRGKAKFSMVKIGAFGAAVAALSGFFDVPWSQPVEKLRQHSKAYALNEVGMALLALGRVTESLESFEGAFRADVLLKDWENASYAAVNLSQTYLAIGELEQSILHAKQGVDLARQANNPFGELANMSTLAGALHQTNQLAEAGEAFESAEQLQQKIQPEFPLLYSYQGFQYWEFLLDQGKYEDVRVRARKTLEWSKQLSGVSLADPALIYLSLSHANLLQAQCEGRLDFTEPTKYLKRAIQELREAGIMQFLTMGVLAQARLYRLNREYGQAQDNLDEAMRIATRGSMGLNEADCHLEYARLHLAQNERDKAREHWVTAKEMIERMSYHRRDKDVKEIEEQLSAT